MDFFLRCVATALLVTLSATAASANATGPVALVEAGKLPEARAALETMLETGAFAAALPGLERLAATGDSPRDAYLLGYGYARLFRFRDAERVLREALAARPAEHGWMHLLARALLEQGRHRAAADWLDRAIALHPDPEYRFAKAMCLLNQSRPADAERALRACLDGNPKHAEALYHLGVVVGDRGDDAESLRLLQLSLELDPHQVDARFRLGQALARTDRPDEAVAELEAVLRVIPGHVGAAYTLGRTLMRLGRHDEGRARLREFAELSELEDAIQFHRELVKKNPTDVGIRMALADHLARAGRLSEAVDTLHAARAIDPGRPIIYRGLGKLYRHLGRTDEARRAAEYAELLERRAS